MLRPLLAALFAAGLLAAAAADDKPKDKAKPKPLPRVAVNDPAKAKEDPDFAVQGEYEGTASNAGGSMKLGVQVVALGGGKFDAKAYRGGLPGAGWDGEKTHAGTAARDGDKVTVSSDGQEVGTIADGTLTIKHGDFSATVKKVERKSPTLGAPPPAGAVVLFAKPGDEENWTKGKLAKLSDGEFLTVEKTGSIKSKKSFGAFTAHVEFRLPWMPNSRGQQRANSGVYVQDRYEVQVLDSFGLKGENNECGGVYTQFKPLVNMCLPPMAWQTYDIDFTPAEFDGDKKVKPARLTVLHNGVKVHDHVELKGPTGGGQPEKPTPGPIQLQDHGDPVVYRNIWVVEKK